MRLFSLVLFSISLLASSLEVDFVVAKPQKHNLTIQCDGVVITKKKVFIVSKSTGILKLFVDNNSYIQPSQKIAKIVDERRVKRLNFLATKLLLLKDEIKSEDLKLADAQDMYQMGVGSKSNYLNEEVLQKQLENRYENVKNEYEILKMQEDNSIIYTNRSGSIINLRAENSYINYGDKIATVLDDECMVKLFVDASYAERLKKGMRVQLKSSYKDAKALISNILSKSSHNLIEVILEVKDKFPIGLRLSADIVLKTVDSLLIPKKAVVLLDNRPVVYILEDAKVHVKYIKIIKDMADTVLIKNTLGKNTKVIVKNAYMLHDNLKVHIR